MDEYYCVSSAYPCHPCGYRQALRAVLLKMDDLEDRFESPSEDEKWGHLKETIEEEIKSLLPGR